MPTVPVRGICLHYAAQGHGPPLLCFPGALGTSRTDFAPQLTTLSIAWRVIAPDPRGYGLSHPPDRDVALDFFQQDADDMAAIMTALGHDGFHGADDPPVSPMHPEILQRNIPNTRLHIFPKGRHNVHQSHAETFNRLVRDFLQEDTTP